MCHGKNETLVFTRVLGVSHGGIEFWPGKLKESLILGNPLTAFEILRIKCKLSEHIFSRM